MTNSHYIYLPTETLNLVRIFGMMSAARDVPGVMTVPVSNGPEAFQNILDITCEMIADHKNGMRHFLAPTTVGKEIDGPRGRDIVLPPKDKIDINLKDAFAYLADRQPGATDDVSVMTVSPSQMEQIRHIHEYVVEAQDCSPKRKLDLSMGLPEKRLGVAADYLLNVMSALKGAPAVCGARTLPGLYENREVVRPLQLGVAMPNGQHFARPIKGLNF